ncbi:Ral GTPase-activating protein subunit alpha-2 [Globomyces sp. JEL0801]|nr:Ral GTPase-activating protein subunit alpha-2 [Globomyces sp. JEL0801]
MSAEVKRQEKLQKKLKPLFEDKLKCKQRLHGLEKSSNETDEKKVFLAHDQLIYNLVEEYICYKIEKIREKSLPIGSKDVANLFETFTLFEKILKYCYEKINNGWMLIRIHTIFDILLHPGNHQKLRKHGLVLLLQFLESQNPVAIESKQLYAKVVDLSLFPPPDVPDEDGSIYECTGEDETGILGEFLMKDMIKNGEKQHKSFEDLNSGNLDNKLQLIIGVVVPKEGLDLVNHKELLNDILNNIVDIANRISKNLKFKEYTATEFSLLIHDESCLKLNQMWNFFKDAYIRKLFPLINAKLKSQTDILKYDKFCSIELLDVLLQFISKITTTVVHLSENSLPKEVGIGLLQELFLGDEENREFIHEMFRQGCISLKDPTPSVVKGNIMLRRFIACETFHKLDQRSWEQLMKSLLDIQDQLFINALTSQYTLKSPYLDDIIQLLTETIFIVWIRSDTKNEQMWRNLEISLNQLGEIENYLKQWMAIMIQMTNILTDHSFKLSATDITQKEDHTKAKRINRGKMLATSQQNLLANNQPNNANHSGHSIHVPTNTSATKGTNRLSKIIGDDPENSQESDKTSDDGTKELVVASPETSDLDRPLSYNPDQNAKGVHIFSNLKHGVRDLLQKQLQLNLDLKNYDACETILWMFGMSLFEESLIPDHRRSKILQTDLLTTLLDFISCKELRIAKAANDGLSLLGCEYKRLIIEEAETMVVISRIVLGISEHLSMERKHVEDLRICVTIVSHLFRTLLDWLMNIPSKLVENPNTALRVSEVIEETIHVAVNGVESQMDLIKQRDKAESKEKDEQTAIGSNDMLNLYQSLKDTAQNTLLHLSQHLDNFSPINGPAAINTLIVDPMEEEIDSDMYQYFSSSNSTILTYVDIPSENACRILIRNAAGKFSWKMKQFHHSIDEVERTHSCNCLKVKTPTHGKPLMNDPKKQSMNTLGSINGLLTRESDILEATLQQIQEHYPECQYTIPSIDSTEVDPFKDLVEQQIEEELKSSLAYHDTLAFIDIPRYSSQILTQDRGSFSIPRLLLSHLGQLSFEHLKASGLQLLQKSTNLLRDIKGLDRKSCREVAKFAVVYVGPGQEDEYSIFRNITGSIEYDEFVSSLGWEVASFGPLQNRSVVTKEALGPMVRATAMNAFRSAICVDGQQGMDVHPFTLRKQNIETISNRHKVSPNTYERYMNDIIHPQKEKEKEPEKEILPEHPIVPAV